LKGTIKYLEFINFMFNENCIERFQDRVKEYPDAEAYFKKNKEFLKKKFLEQNKF